MQGRHRFLLIPGVPSLSRKGHVAFEIMKALIIYQDFESAMKANTTLQNLKLSPDTGIDWEVIPWRMDMLRFPPTATEALIAATDAHLMLFAGQLPESLPFWLLDWLREWAAARQVKDAALGVTASAKGDALYGAAISGLRQFAQEHGLSFVMDPNVVVREAWINPRLVDAPSAQPQRHWGINE
jgi:hypothetical protein